VTDAAWSGTASNRALLGLGGVLCAAALAAFVITSEFVLTASIAFAGLLLITSSRLTMSVSRAGAEVRWGPIGWPVNRVHIEDIVEVQAVAIRPLHAGGWGYRGSRVLFNRAAALVRRGPAIRLELARGKVFVITVDDAVEGAAILQSIVERRSR